GQTWVSPTIYWSNSSDRVTIDNFNATEFNGSWTEVPDFGESSSNDGTFTKVDDSTNVAQGYAFYVATNSSTSDKIFFKKEFDNAIALQDSLHVLHKGNAILKFYSGSETPYSSGGDGNTSWDTDMTDWAYRTKFTVTEQTGSAQTDLQFKITFNSKRLIDAGRMQSDGADIRVYDGDGNSLDFWLDDSTINTTSTELWVKASFTASEEKIIYVYYGNDSATSTSNGDNVFDFFDDFDGTSLSGDWTVSGAVSVSNSVVSLDNDDIIWASGSTGWQTGYITEAKSKADEQDIKFIQVGDSASLDPNNLLAIINADARQNNVFDGFTLQSRESGNALNLVDVTGKNNWQNTYYIYGIHWISSSSVKFYQGDTYLGEITSSIPSTDLKPNFAVYDNSQESQLDVDWVRVRKYVSTEPTVAEIQEDAYSWHLTEYDYRRPITLSEQSSSDLTDYQVKLTIDTATLISEGRLQSDGDDIRFTDVEGTNLSYWIEDGLNTSTTNIWVKVPSITADCIETIYFYYGNGSATAGSSLSIVFGTNTVSLWSLEETSGTTANDVWGNNDGSNINTPTLNVTGVKQKCYTFTSANSEYIELPYSSDFDVGTGDFTLAFWFKTSTSERQTFFHLSSSKTGDAGSLWVRTEPTNSRIRALIDGGSTYEDVVSTSDKIDGNWHHVVFLRDSGTTYLYIDGLEIDSASSSLSISRNGTDKEYIGCLDGTANFMDGQIDEVMFWDRALTSTEIANMYASTEPTYSLKTEETQASGDDYSAGTLEFTATLTGNPTEWTESEFDTSSKDGTSINRILIEDSDTDYYEQSGSDYNRFALDAIWTKDTDRSTTWEEIEFSSSGSITLDILDASDTSSVLQSSLSSSPIDLTGFSNLEGKNIKIRANLDTNEELTSLTISYKPELSGDN
ncbi:hypothetical protein DRH14_05240, partial [Candidatus Shapirobacteria bacterium]